MITFFTIPKPFKGHSSIIQTNAILSWKKIKKNCEILVFGNHSTISDFCSNNSLKYIDDFKSNEYGTPLLDNIWKSAKNISSNSLICYINSDIIVLPDFAEKINSIKLDEFLIAGRRWDIDIDELIDFKSDWTLNLKNMIAEKGILHSETGSDYFLFPKSCMPDMPAFAIGRAWWDNWLFYYFKKNKISIIDGTNIMTVHQNHDYIHIKSVSNSTTNIGLEREQNKKIANLKYWNDTNISDADFILFDGQVKKVSFLKKLFRVYQKYFLGTFSSVKKIIVQLIPN